MIRSFRPNLLWLSCAVPFVLAGCGSTAEVPSGYACTKPQEVVCIPASGAAYCSDLATDKSNCGACGTVCVAPDNGGTVSCVAGKCVPACPAGTGGMEMRLCSASSGAGGTGPTIECVDVASDVKNCGICGTVCKSNERCTNGACVIAGGPGLGTTACGEDASGNTIFKDLLIDRANCGACGVACGDGEVCSAGSCTPCPISRCLNACVDTQSDPKNCGACGVTATVCDHGIVRSKPVISISFGQPAIAGGFAPTTEFDQYVTVTSTFRLQDVVIEYTIGGNAKVGPKEMTFRSVSSDQWSTDWSYHIASSTPAGTAISMIVTAYDELYRPGRADASDHIAQATVNVTTKVPAATTPGTPEITIANSTSTLPTASAGANVAWVPLNAPTLTIKCKNPCLPSADFPQVEFQVNQVSNPKARIAGVPAADVAWTVLPAELGIGTNLKIRACPVDLWGNTYTANCSAEAWLSVGRLTPQATANAPVIAKALDGSARTIFAVGKPSTGSFPIHFHPYDQAFVSQPNGVSAEVGTAVGANSYLPDSMFLTAEGSGVVAIKKDGTSVHRIEAAAAPAAKENYVVPVAPTKFGAIEEQGISKVALALRDQANNALWFANGTPTSTDPAPTFGGGLLTPIGAQRVAQTLPGALVAWVTPTSSNAAPQVDLFHPSISSGGGLKAFPAVANAVPTGLTVFPGGEMVAEYLTTSSTHFLMGIYFDASATPIAQPIVTSSTAYGSTTNGSLGMAFFVPRPGVVVGWIPSASSTAGTTNYDLIEINFKATTADKVVVLPAKYNGTPGPDSQGAPLNTVAQRSGCCSYFSTSDDRSKVLFMTTDTLTSPTRTAFAIRLLDLTTSTAVLVHRSEYYLESYVPGTLYPRFVRAASSYAPEQPLTGDRPVVVWTEGLPAYGGSATNSYFARLYFTKYPADGSAVTVREVDTPVAVQLQGQPATDSIVASAAANAYVFLTQTTGGEFALYSASFDGTGSTTLVKDRVLGMAAREDKAGLLVARDDGVLWKGSLQSGVTGLVPVMDGLRVGPPTFNPGAFIGWTPDGNHAWALTGAALSGYNQYYDGVLQSLDLATGVRTTWGRTVQYSSATDVVLFDDAKALIGLTTLTRFTQIPIAFTATSDATATRKDTRLLAPTSGFPSIGPGVTSLDLTEGMASSGGTAAHVRKDKTVTLYPGLDGSPLYARQVATYVPFGGLRLPDWGVMGFTPAAGPQIFWRKFGGATADTTHPVLTGSFVPLDVARARFTPDRGDWLFHGKSGSDSYLAAVPGPAKAALKVPVE